MEGILSPEAKNKEVKMSQEDLDHWADLHNPNSNVYQDDLDNHADQLNPNNDEYWNSRDMEGPDY